VSFYKKLTMTLWHEIDYSHANPVRRGLCRGPEDWHWSIAASEPDRSR